MTPKEQGYFDKLCNRMEAAEEKEEAEAKVELDLIQNHQKMVETCTASKDKRAAKREELNSLLQAAIGVDEDEDCRHCLCGSSHSR